MMHLAGRMSWLTVVLSLVVAGTAEAGDTGRLVADETGLGGTSTTKEQQYCNKLPDQPEPPPAPVVAQQYTAKVEMVQLVTNASGHQYKLLDYAEYVYDATAKLVSIQVYSKYFLVRYLLNWNTKQMVEVVVSKTGVQEKKCVVRGLEEALILFPAIWGTGKNLSTEQIVAPGVLMGLPEEAEIRYKGRFDCRGILCSRWDWCGLKQFEQDAGTELVTMATFWNVPGWQVPVQQYQTLPPLGWEVEVQYSKDDGSILFVEEKVHNVMYYRPEVVDYSALLISQDIYCSGLIPEPGHPFPDFMKDYMFTFSMEARETMANTITWADGWYDFEKQLYRIDHDVMMKGRDAVPTTEIFDFIDKVAFTFPQESLGKCKVTVINNTHTDWSDITGIGHLWADNPNAFFGTDVVNYTYYGPAVVRYVEGQEWRAVRTDWPPDAVDGDTHTLWQWTFAGKNVSVVTDLGEHLYLERQVPIGLRVTALHDMETSLGHIPKGSAYVYQLYDFNLEWDSRFDIYSDGGDFDTYDCYSANWREHLKFRLDVSAWPEVVTTPLMTSSWFNEQWQKQLAQFGQVSVLRITRVKVARPSLSCRYLTSNCPALSSHSPAPHQASLHTPAPHQASLHTPVPHQASLHTPAPHQASLHTPAPHQASLHTPAPHQASLHTPAHTRRPSTLRPTPGVPPHSGPTPGVPPHSGPHQASLHTPAHTRRPSTLRPTPGVPPHSGPHQASLHTPAPHQASLHTPAPHQASLHTPVPHQASLHTPVPHQASLHTPVPHQASLHTPAPHQASLHTPVPHQASLHTPAPHQASLHTPAPHQASLHTPAPHQASLHTPAPHQASLHTPAPHQASLHTPAPHQASLHTPAHTRRPSTLRPTPGVPPHSGPTPGVPPHSGPHQASLHTPAPHQASLHTPAPHQASLHTPAPHQASLHTPVPHQASLHTPAPHQASLHTPAPHQASLHTPAPHQASLHTPVPHQP
ncbi:uncharacterized protein [Panulirus ornatus]|uniref:uncharacterized protein n=1 Tax=Panulirus ornatus TaxID=150431 RepID=UPI003A8B74AA